MKKDNAALFVLFSILTYVPLAEARPPELDCHKITTSAVLGQGRYAVFCGEQLQQDAHGEDSFSAVEADTLVESKNLETEKYEQRRDLRLENDRAKEAGKPIPYPEAEREEEPPFGLY